MMQHADQVLGGSEKGKSAIIEHDHEDIVWCAHGNFKYTCCRCIEAWRANIGGRFTELAKKSSCSLSPTFTVELQRDKRGKYPAVIICSRDVIEKLRLNPEFYPLFMHIGTFPDKVLTLTRVDENGAQCFPLVWSSHCSGRASGIKIDEFLHKFGVLRFYLRQHKEAVRDEDLTDKQRKNLEAIRCLAKKLAEGMPEKYGFFVEWRIEAIADLKANGSCSPDSRRIGIDIQVLASGEKTLDIFIHEGTHACLESKGLTKNMGKSMHGRKFVLALSTFAADVARIMASDEWAGKFDW
jgi:hypothetical protein